MSKSNCCMFLAVIWVMMIFSGCSVLDRAINNKVEEVNAPILNDMGKEKLKIVDFFLPAQNSKPRTERITHVMIHYISNVARNQQKPYDVNDIHSIFKEYGVSSHYLIGRNGEIYRVVPEDQVAYHAGTGMLPDFPEYENSLNEYSIGIELLAIGTRDEMLKVIPREVFDSVDPSLIGYTDAQYESLKALLKDIQKRNPFIQSNRKHIVGHDEYAPTRKTDPGSLFDWSRIGIGDA